MIEFCEWRDEYLTGDALIDGEHQRICEMACLFGRQVEAGTITYREAISVVREVMRHIVSHFIHEEILLTIYGISEQDIIKHKREHQRLRILFTAAADEIRDQRSDTFQQACLNLLNYLHMLITQHIQEEDVQLLKHVRESNVVLC